MNNDDNNMDQNRRFRSITRDLLAKQENDGSKYIWKNQ